MHDLSFLLVGTYNIQQGNQLTGSAVQDFFAFSISEQVRERAEKDRKLLMLVLSFQWRLKEELMSFAILC